MVQTYSWIMVKTFPILLNNVADVSVGKYLANRRWKHYFYMHGAGLDVCSHVSIDTCWCVPTHRLSTAPQVSRDERHKNTAQFVKCSTGQCKRWNWQLICEFVLPNAQSFPTYPHPVTGGKFWADFFLPMQSPLFRFLERIAKLAWKMHFIWKTTKFLKHFFVSLKTVMNPVLIPCKTCFLSVQVWVFWILLSWSIRPVCSTSIYN